MGVLDCIGRRLGILRHIIYSVNRWHHRKYVVYYRYLVIILFIGNGFLSIAIYQINQAEEAEPDVDGY